jgi:hypothetical protein
MNNGVPEIDDNLPGLLESVNETGSPERRLILGIIERAILDYVGNELKEREQAAEWIFDDENDDEDQEFTFAWACSQLDLPISRIRSKIRQMPMRGDSRLAPWYQNKTPSIGAMNNVTVLEEYAARKAG